jgi:hypothetical protein
LIDIFDGSKDLELKNVIHKFNAHLSIPRGYNIDFETDSFVSLSIETPRSSQVIFLYHYPYTGPSDFVTENIVQKRNEVLKKHTEGSRKGSYMTTASLYPPLAFDLQLNGDEIVEVRGLWELVNGYMGGPFISHCILDQSRNRIVVVEAYVYNPNKKKRNLMRQMEAIVYSLEIIE